MALSVSYTLICTGMYLAVSFLSAPRRKTKTPAVPPSGARPVSGRHAAMLMSYREQEINRAIIQAWLRREEEELLKRVVVWKWPKVSPKEWD